MSPRKWTADPVPDEPLAQVITQPEFVALLRRRALVSQKALAYDLGVSQSLLSDVLTGKHPPPPQLARALGYEKRTVYVRIGDAG